MVLRSRESRKVACRGCDERMSPKRVDRRGLCATCQHISTRSVAGSPALGGGAPAGRSSPRVADRGTAGIPAGRTLTVEQVDAAWSPAGWDRHVLAGWGVPWPLPPGWRAALLTAGPADSAAPARRAPAPPASRKGTTSFCRATVQAGGRCSFEAGPRGLCHLHDPDGVYAAQHRGMAEQLSARPDIAAALTATAPLLPAARTARQASSPTGPPTPTRAPTAPSPVARRPAPRPSPPAQPQVDLPAGPPAAGPSSGRVSTAPAGTVTGATGAAPGSPAQPPVLWQPVTGPEEAGASKTGRVGAGPIGLRGYQQLAVTLARAEVARTGRAHVSLATGTGKSRVLAELARIALDGHPANPAGTVLVAVPQIQIRHQMAVTLAATGHRVGELPGPIGDEPILVGTAATLAGWTARSGATPRLVLVDEAHHATADGHRALFAACPEAKRVGVTATPYRHDGADLADVLGRCVFVREPDHPDLDGVLVPARWRAVRLPVSLDKVTQTKAAAGGDYQAAGLGAALGTPAAVHATVDATVDAITARPTVVFAATVDHARALATAYRGRAGLAADVVLGTTPAGDRAATIDALTHRRLDVVVTVGALTEGFDCPPVAALVMARPTRSELLYTQMLGRGLRAHPGKTDCVVLDVTGYDGDSSPSATGQVFLPTVAASTGEDPRDPDPDRWWDSPAGTEHPGARQIVGTDRTAPAWSWAPGPGGIWQVPLADGATGVLVPDGDTGLYRPLVIIDHRTVIALDGPLPSRYAVNRFTGLADARLSPADATWRTKPMTPEQHHLLHRHDQAVATRAGNQSWTRGHASGVISAFIAAAAVTRSWHTMMEAPADQ